MTKDEWVTIVFALERYIEELEDEGSTVTPHIYNTLSKAVVEQGKAQ